MRRVFKKCVAVALAAAMVVTLAPANADAAKKVKLSAKSKTLKVKKSFTLKVKNGSKKAKVSWKTSNKKVAALSKQVKKGNKASVKVTGKKKGSAKITATYKLGKKTTKLTCKVTVGKVPAPTAAPATTAPAVVPTTAPTTVPATATPVPTQKATLTPRPTATPSPRPKNTNLDAYGLGKDADGNEAVITVDGVVDETWEDSKSNDLLTAITKESGIRGGESKVTAATASIMWGANAAYVLVDVKKADVADTDSVTIYFDENAKATADTVQKVTVKAGESGKSTKTADGYIVEAKFDIAAAKEVDSAASIEIQINEGDVTTNYYDTRSAMIFNEETKAFELGDATVAVAEKPELMGQLSLLKSMAQSTLAYYTADGAALRAEADIDNGEWSVPAEDGADQVIKAKKVKFVDTKYWTDAYGDNAAIKFPNYNLSSTNGGTAYAPDGRGSNNVSLMKKVENADGTVTYESDPDIAKAYIIWDEDYIYALFDIKDADVTASSATGGEEYLTDSTEFFLNEDNVVGGYLADGDEIQIRVAPADNSFSSEGTANTGSYELVAHAAKVTEGVGYQVQYIVKLKNKHKAGDIMGMDLQVNDCETITTTSTDEEGNEVEVTTTARACTITAYDTTNNAYADPSCFGRVKLIDPNATPGDGGNDDAGNNDNPGNEGGEVADTYTVTVAAANECADATNATKTYNAEGGVAVTLERKWGGMSIAFNAKEDKTPLNIKQYSKCIVNVTVAEGKDCDYTVGYITDVIAGDYWKTNTDKQSFLAGQSTKFTAGTNNYEFDLTGLEKSTGDDGGRAFERDPEKVAAIYIQALGSETAGEIGEFTLNSITFVK